MHQQKPLFNPVKSQLHIKTIDMHTGGEPLRIIVGGVPDVKGKTILEKRAYFQQHLDYIRTGIVFEPRGHADMYGAIIVEPERPDSDFGVLFLHNEGYSTMCGHAIIALAKFAMHTGRLKPGQIKLKIDVPAGQVEACLNLRDGEIVSSSFINVPSFVLSQNQKVNISGMGSVLFDIAYGGAFYAICDASQWGLKIEPERHLQLVEMGKKIKNKIIESHAIHHPMHKELGFLYGVIFTSESHNPGVHSKNACIFADGELDRSATGSGVSARAALLHRQNKLKTGEEITIESITGSSMQVKVLETLPYGGYPAVVPQVTGSAYFTGQHEFYFEPNDPFNQGFIFK